MATPSLRRRTATETAEREIVDRLVAHTNEYPREVVVNYYVTLKTKRFVILAGPPEVDKTGLAQKLADILVGRSSLQAYRLQAHPWWATHTGAPAHFAGVHTRFNFLKLLNCIEVASAVQVDELPFFVTVKRMSPAEVVCYFHDLPRGLLWRADGSTLQVPLPNNLYVTGTLEVQGQKCFALSQERYRYATVVQVDHNHFALSAAQGERPQHRPDWQQRFARWAARCRDHAEAKLARFLPGGVSPLAPLIELERRLERIDLPPFVIEEAWLYLANAFASDGRGLFVDPSLDNLHIAQDYVLLQCVLPYLGHQLVEAPGTWDGVSGFLAPRFPRAFQALTVGWPPCRHGSDRSLEEDHAMALCMGAGGENP